MKCTRLLPLLTLTSFGCTGQIMSGPGADPRDPPPRGDMTEAPKPPAGCKEIPLAKPRVWRLTHAQLKRTLADGLGVTVPVIDMFPAESRVEGYANRADKLPIAPLLADYYFKASDDLGAQVLQKSAELFECAMAQLGTNTACLRKFIGTFGLKMWRRPPTDAEVTKFAQLYAKAAAEAGGPEMGVRAMVQAFFLSPNFLYRTEVGDNQQAGAVTNLTDYELASALSYMLWDAPPDATLLDLARQGKLRDRTVLATQARRLLAAQQKAPEAMHHFLQQWLKIEGLPNQSKDPTLFSVYSPQVASDLMVENRMFMDSVIFENGGDRSFRTLFTAPYGFVNARTAPLYGLEDVTAAHLTKTQLPADQRRGLLTLPSFLAAHADPDGTHLVDRGRYMREEVLCSRVPDPNIADAVFDPKFATEDMTGREKFMVHSTNPACAGCHVLFDSLGFALESYDGIGRYRTTDKGKQIDPSGEIPLPSGGDLAFSNFVDLIDKLAKTKDLYDCFSTQYLAYSTGRDPTDISDCERGAIAEEFVKSSYKVDTLVFSVVNSPSFTARKN